MPVCWLCLDRASKTAHGRHSDTGSERRESQRKKVLVTLQWASEPPGGLLKHRESSPWPTLQILRDWGRPNLKICISSKFLGDAVVMGPQARLRATTVEQGSFPIWQVTQTNPGPHLETALSTLESQGGKKSAPLRERIYSARRSQGILVYSNRYFSN